MRQVFLAAFAALSVNTAQADDGVPAVRPDEPCVGCGKTPKPAPAPAPVAPAPAPAPEPDVVVTPPPAPVAPAPGVINVILPPEDPGPEEKGRDQFRIGGLVGVNGGGWAVPADIVDGRSHDVLPAGEAAVGTYIGYLTTTDPKGIYVGISAQFGRGSIASTSWSGELAVGAVARRGVVLGLTAGGEVRDLAVQAGQYNSRFTGAGAGLFGLVDLMPKKDTVLDLSLVPDGYIIYGTARNPVTGEVISPSPDFGAGLALRVGVKSRK